MSRATQSDRLPTDCPECGSTLATRGDAMVHMLAHVGSAGGER